jgi:hypothetical protein
MTVVKEERVLMSSKFTNVQRQTLKQLELAAVRVPESVSQLFAEIFKDLFQTELAGCDSKQVARSRG